MATQPSQEYPAEVVRGTFFEHDVPVSKMFVHFRTQPDGYARPLSVRRLNKLIAEFDRQALGVALLSMRNDGTFAIIDAQHRWEACKFLAIPTMDALVYIDLSLEDEARLYRKFGDYLKQTPLDKYHAALAEKVPEYLFVQRTLSDRGLIVPVTPSDSNNMVVAVDALLNVCRTYGHDIFTETIDLLHNAWDGEHRAFRGLLIQGTAAFLARYRSSKKYKPNRLISRMQSQGLSNIERRAALLREANLTLPNAAWGQALLFVHDHNVKDDLRLGAWPARHISETQAAKYAQNMRDINAAKTPEQKKAAAQKANASMTPEQRSQRTFKGLRKRLGYHYRDVVCPTCNAMVSDPCITESGQVFYTYHASRRELAKTNAHD